MAEFASYRSYGRFAHACRTGYRYIRSTESDAFLATVLETGESRARLLEARILLWRAQLGHDWRPEPSGGEDFEVECALPAQRMIPLPDRAAEGRANPKGIPFLYLSDSKETAMGEVRPWVGSYVSAGQFELLRDVRLVDFTKTSGGFSIYFHEHEPEPEERRDAVWKDLDRAFAEPVSQSDHTADYAPTQIIAELFRSNEYDGIVYKSSLGTGLNVALFDLAAAKLVNCTLYRVKAVSFEFSEQDMTYYVREN